MRVRGPRRAAELLARICRISGGAEANRRSTRACTRLHGVRDARLLSSLLRMRGACGRWRGRAVDGHHRIHTNASCRRSQLARESAPGEVDITAKGTPRRLRLRVSRSGGDNGGRNSRLTRNSRSMRKELCSHPNIPRVRSYTYWPTVSPRHVPRPSPRPAGTGRALWAARPAS